MKLSAWFHLLAAVLLVTPAFASPVRTRTLTSPDAVPEGLSAPEWSSIRQQYEQQRHGDASVQEWFVNDRAVWSTASPCASGRCLVAQVSQPAVSPIS